MKKSLLSIILLFSLYSILGNSLFAKEGTSNKEFIAHFKTPPKKESKYLEVNKNQFTSLDSNTDNEYYTAENFVGYSTGTRYEDTENGVAILGGTVPWLFSTLVPITTNLSIEVTAISGTNIVGFSNMHSPWGRYLYFDVNNELHISDHNQSHRIQVRGIGTYEPGDSFKIEKKGEKLSFYKNGTLFYEEDYPIGNRENLCASIRGFYKDIRVKELDADFEVKLVDPIDRFDSNEVSHQNIGEIIGKNMVDQIGNKCQTEQHPNYCTEKFGENGVVPNLKSGSYFFHIGTGGDNSYYDSAETVDSYYFLNDEFSTIGALVKNNTASNKQIRIKVNNVPGRSIKLRKEATIDGFRSRSSVWGVRIVGDPLPELIKDDEEWVLDLYSNETVKIILEFNSDYSKYMSGNSFMSLYDGNNIINVNLPIEVSSKTVPKGVVGRFISSVDLRMNTTTGALNSPLDYELANNSRLNTVFADNTNLPSYRGRATFLEFNPDGSITSESMNKDYSFLQIFKFIRWLKEGNYYEVYYSFGNKSHFKTTNNIELEYFSDEWINAYVNTLTFTMQLLNQKASEFYGEDIDLQSQVLVWALDENTGLPMKDDGEVDEVAIEKLYKKIKEKTNLLTTRSFGNGQKVVNSSYYDVIKTGTTINAFEYPLSTLVSYYNNHSLFGTDNTDSGINFFRRIGLRQAYVYGYGNFACFPPFGNVKDAWSGNYSGPSLIYEKKKNEDVGQWKVADHWNPIGIPFDPSIDNSNSYKEINRVPSLRLYAIGQGNLDTDIYNYLSKLNNSIINEKLEQHKNLLENRFISLKEIRRISNQLKELYTQYYQESTQSSSRQVIEEKELPSFEEPLSFTVVYPNPTDGDINVKAEKDIKAWKVVSMSGKAVRYGQFNAPTKQFNTNISNQTDGLYVLQIIYTDGTSESKKIMKK